MSDDIRKRGPQAANLLRSEAAVEELFCEMIQSNFDDLGVRIGDVVAGRYRIERRIGVGGMGAVVAAHHMQFGGKVALKILLPKAARDKEAVTRFSREARAMFHLKSEHAAKVIEIGQLPSGGPYMVMEYLEGTDLATLLARNGAFPAMESVGLILQACEAIAEAHSLGIVHRDIKPQNLFVTKRVDGSAFVKVLDFGISKVPLQSGEHMCLTRSSAVMGTPLYMSPEQLAASVDADAQSDVWAIGVVLYELLTGEVPYDAPSAPALYAKMLSWEPPTPTQVNPDVDPELSAVVMQCLARDRDKRCQSIAELASMLEPFAPSSMSGAGLRLRAVHERNTQRLSIPSDEASALGALPTQITWEGAETRTRKRTLAAALGVCAGITLFVVGIVGLHPMTTRAATSANAVQPPAVAASVRPPPPSNEPGASATASTVASGAASAHAAPPVRPEKKAKLAAPKESADPNAFFTHRTL